VYATFDICPLFDGAWEFFLVQTSCWFLAVLLLLVDSI
jgi:hypothetical protein